jgi:acyl carrier protein
MGVTGMDTKARVMAAIQSTTEKKIAAVEEDESLFDSGLLDSFALPELVSGLEKEFGIKIPDSDLNPRKFETLARITEYVESRM